MPSQLATQPPVRRRDAAARRRYLQAVWHDLPRLLGLVDRNPFHATYGCFDRQYWHYRTAAFPCEMYQEAVLPLALAYATELPGNRWFLEPRVRELAIAGLRFSARAAHADGSCDDYYPYERALGAAVFSLAAAAQAYTLLELDDPEIRQGLIRRAGWVAGHGESGRLANHQALAALALLRTWQATGEHAFLEGAHQRVRQVLHWQSGEGWFEEYGGADPGYQTVTISCLAQFQRAVDAPWLAEPLRRAIEFCGWFLHPDQSYGGEYGSRGTYHFYPHGFELLARHNATAARLADGFLASLNAGTQGRFDDDRLFIHRLGNLIGAYIDWSSDAPAEIDNPPPASLNQPQARYFQAADILVHRAAHGTTYTVASGARGGVFKHFSAAARPATDAGWVVETNGGRLAVSQQHDLTRESSFEPCGPNESASGGLRYQVQGRLHWARHETATPVKQAVFHVGMTTVGRWCRTLVRRLLQRRLITQRHICPIQLTRVFEFDDARLRVSDTLELLDPSLQVRRVALASDQQAAYVAATLLYHDHALEPWRDLPELVEQLNRDRKITLVRQW